ncbi:hypothetical protein K469DRAFT_688035 [Zopfia rhizophila CBS 207.26]|uniref:NB-ARC domain-containing protein n=1 Tax=Zopfia rhizophila CBS 207.26 TaxID=1314779 RepID=A0A6A6E1X3_9PEZI|nr:hypothetical protein K469DRAFT_688035 [Zopfia rhizophila CBS 207.26]
MHEPLVSSQSRNLLSDLKDSCFQKSRNPNFTGRSAELDRLDAYFLNTRRTDRNCSLRMVVYGLGGIGVRDERQTLIVWFDASGTKNLVSQYQERAQLLRSFAAEDANVKKLVNIYGLPGKGTDLVKSWIAAHGDWILVMDNFDTISIDVDTFIPMSGRIRVIFTSRDRRAIGTAANHGFELKQPGLSEAELLFFRQRNTGRMILQEDLRQYPEYTAAKEIVKNLDGFPLALSQAAAYIRENDPFTCREYLELLTARQEDREILLRFKEVKPDYPESVMTTWEISLDYLKKNHPEAAELLQLLGFLAHSEIPEEILIQATEPTPWYFGTAKVHRRLTKMQCEELNCLKLKARFQLYLGRLASLSLVSKDGRHSISVHPLVHEWIQTRLKPEPRKAARFARLCGLIAYQAYPLHQHVPSSERQLSYQALMKLQRLDPHLLEVLGNLGRYEQHFGSIPLEVRTLLLARLLSMIVEKQMEWDKMLSSFVKTFSSGVFPPQDSLESVQSGIFETLRRFGSSRQCKRSVQIMRVVESSLASDFVIHKWTQAKRIYIVILTFLILRIIDISLQSPNDRPYSEQLDGNTNQRGSSLTSRLQEKSGLTADQIGHPEPSSEEEEMRLCTIAALSQLLSFLSIQGPNVPDEIPFLEIMVKSKLSTLMTFKQYWTPPRRFLIEGLSLDHFKHVGIRTTAAYFATCTRFHGLDLQGITSVILLSKEVFEKWCMQEEDRTVIDETSFSSYISSGFGRGHDLSTSSRSRGPKIDEEELEAMWNASLRCVDAVIEKLDATLCEATKKAAVDGLFSMMKAIEDLCGSLRRRCRLLVSRDLMDHLGSAKWRREIHKRYAKIYFTAGDYNLSLSSLQIVLEADAVLRQKKDAGFSPLKLFSSSKLDSNQAGKNCNAIPTIPNLFVGPCIEPGKVSTWNPGLRNHNHWMVPLTGGDIEPAKNRKSTPREFKPRYNILFPSIRDKHVVIMCHLWIECLVRLGRADMDQQGRWHEIRDQILVKQWEHETAKRVKSQVANILGLSSVDVKFMISSRTARDLGTLALVYELATASMSSAEQDDAIPSLEENDAGNNFFSSSVTVEHNSDYSGQSAMTFDLPQESPATGDDVFFMDLGID